MSTDIHYRAGDSVIPLDHNDRPVIPFVNNSWSNLRFRSEWQEWLSTRDFALFSTLTYDHRVARQVAERDLYHFRARLYDKVYGKKAGGYLSFVGFLESTRAGNLHWHLLFENILPKAGESAQQALERLGHFIKRVWLKMGNTPSSGAGFDVQRVYDQPRVIDYCLKESASQSNFDFIKAEHLAVQTERNTLIAS